MSCDQFDKVGIFYLYGELNQADKDLYEAHMRSCDFCRNSIRQLNEVKIHCSNLSDSVPSRNILFKIKLYARKQLIGNTIRFFRENKRTRIRLVPSIAMVGLVLIMLITISKPWNSSPEMVQKQHLAWSNGTDAAIDSLDQEIDMVYSDIFLSTATSSFSDSNNPLEGLSLHELNPKKLEQDINLLVSKYKQFIF